MHPTLAGSTRRLAAAAAVLLAAQGGTEPPADLGAGNLLSNPGFEEGFRAEGASELVVGDGWHPWYRSAQTRPEFKDERSERRRPDGGIEAFSIRVLHGEALQKFFTFSATHDAGLYQAAAVPAGATVRFSVWVEAWSSDCDDPCVSPLAPCREGSPNTHGTYRVSAGIDPTGAEPPVLGSDPPETVIWSDAIVYEAYDRWFRLQVEAQAEADRVTVYARGNPAWPVKHNDSYWDDARLEIVTPPPSPTTARLFLPSALRGIAGMVTAQAPSSDSRQAAPSLPGRRRDPVPPGADVRIDYPVRAYPDQENFRLPTCDDLEFEAVVIRNHGDVTVGLEGWTLEDREGSAYTFPALTLAPAEAVRVWTKRGPNTRLGPFADLYWDRTEPVWNGPSAERPFDEAVLRDDQGTEVARRGYP